MGSREGGWGYSWGAASKPTVSARSLAGQRWPAPSGLSTLSLLFQAFSDADRKIPGGSACNWQLLLSEGKVNYADGSVIHPGGGISLGAGGGLELPLSPSLGLRALELFGRAVF